MCRMRAGLRDCLVDCPDFARRDSEVLEMPFQYSLMIVLFEIAHGDFSMTIVPGAEHPAPILDSQSILPVTGGSSLLLFRFG